MKRLNRLPILFAAIALMIASCNDKPKSNEEIIQLEKEVLQIHDEVMPKMSDIAKLMSILETEAQNPTLDSIAHGSILKSISELTSGDSLMWEWMHNYKKPENTSHDSAKAYLISEKERITKVRDAMLSGIKNAESLVQQLSHEQAK